MRRTATAAAVPTRSRCGTRVLRLVVGRPAARVTEQAPRCRQIGEGGVVGSDAGVVVRVQCLGSTAERGPQLPSGRGRCDAEDLVGVQHRSHRLHCRAPTGERFRTVRRHRRDSAGDADGRGAPGGGRRRRPWRPPRAARPPRRLDHGPPAPALRRPRRRRRGGAGHLRRRLAGRRPLGRQRASRRPGCGASPSAASSACCAPASAGPGCAGRPASRTRSSSPPRSRCSLGVEHGDLAGALLRLSPELRAVVQATVLDGLTTREAGRLLGIPAGHRQDPDDARPCRAPRSARMTHRPPGTPPPTVLDRFAADPAGVDDGHRGVGRDPPRRLRRLPGRAGRGCRIPTLAAASWDAVADRIDRPRPSAARAAPAAPRRAQRPGPAGGGDARAPALGPRRRRRPHRRRRRRRPPGRRRRAVPRSSPRSSRSPPSPSPSPRPPTPAARRASPRPSPAPGSPCGGPSPCSSSPSSSSPSAPSPCPALGVGAARLGAARRPPSPSAAWPSAPGSASRSPSPGWPRAWVAGVGVVRVPRRRRRRRSPTPPPSPTAGQGVALALTVAAAVVLAARADRYATLEARAMNTSTGVSVTGLRKRFGATVALDGVDATFGPGRQRPARTERRRQDDAAAHPRHGAASRRRRRSTCSASTRRRATVASPSGAGSATCRRSPASTASSPPSSSSTTSPSSRSGPTASRATTRSAGCSSLVGLERRDAQADPPALRRHAPPGRASPRR